MVVGHRLLHAGPSRAVRVAGLAARLGVVRVTMLTPELQSVRDMLALSRGALEGGVRLLHVFFHSVALRPGLSPLTSSAGDVGRLYKTIDSYVEGLSRIGSVRFATVSEDRKSTRLNSSHGYISYAVFCLKKKKKTSLVQWVSSQTT